MADKEEIFMYIQLGSYQNNLWRTWTTLCSKTSTGW